jgi:hypothetical protein
LTGMWNFICAVKCVWAISRISTEWISVSETISASAIALYWHSWLPNKT